MSWRLGEDCHKMRCSIRLVAGWMDVGNVVRLMLGWTTMSSKLGNCTARNQASSMNNHRDLDQSYIATPYEDTLVSDSDDSDEHVSMTTDQVEDDDHDDDRDGNLSSLKKHMVDASTALKHMNRLLKQSKDVQSDMAGVDDAMMLALCRHMSEFLMLSIGNPNQLQEKITALSVTQTYLGKLHHLTKGSHGADLQSNRGTVEDKTSTSACAGNGYTTNWIFGSLKADSKQQLIDKFMSKMQAGVVLKSVLKNSSIVLNTYVIPGTFMANYLARMTTLGVNKTSKVINLGSARCATCHHYHRILWLIAWSKVKTEWQSDKLGHDPDMHRIKVNIPTQCASLSAQQRQFMGLSDKL